MEIIFSRKYQFLLRMCKLIQWVTGPGHHPVPDLTPGSVTGPCDTGMIQCLFTRNGTALWYLKFKPLICLPRSFVVVVQKTTKEKLKMKQELQKSGMLPPIWESEKGTLKYILNKHAQLHFHVLHLWRIIWSQRTKTMWYEKITPNTNKFKCFITFNAYNKYPIWNIKKDIHFNQMGPQKRFAS